jgi:ureidoacrylate peracid hydrolase
VAPRRVMRELGEIVDPGHTALLVVDVQNDFCHRDGGLAQGGGDMTAIEQAIGKLDDTIRQARKAGIPVIFLRIVQSPETNSEAWESLEPEEGPRLVVAGSWGADYYAPIGPAEGDLEIVKHRHSGFVATSLDLALRSMGIKTVVLGGVASNVCVEATARDAAPCATSCTRRRCTPSAPTSAGWPAPRTSARSGPPPRQRAGNRRGRPIRGPVTARPASGLLGPRWSGRR